MISEQGALTYTKSNWTVLIRGYSGNDYSQRCRPVQFDTVQSENTEVTAAANSPVLLLTQGSGRHNLSIRVKAGEAKEASKNLIWT